MRKATSIIATAALLAFASASEGQDFDGSSVKHIQSVEFEKENEFKLQKAENERETKDFEKDRSEHFGKRFQKETELEKEKDYRRTNRNIRKHDNQKRKSCNHRLGALRTGENKINVRNNENEVAEKNQNCGRVKQADFHHEEVEEKAHIVSESDGKSGEKVRSQKWVKKREHKKGIKQREGEGRNLRLIKNRGQACKQVRSRKAGCGKKEGSDENRRNTCTDVCENEVEKEIDCKTKVSKDVNQECDKDEKLRVSKEKAESKNLKLKVEKEVEVKKEAAKEKQVKADCCPRNDCDNKCDDDDNHDNCHDNDAHDCHRSNDECCSENDRDNHCNDCDDSNDCCYQGDDVYKH
jgi:hypothetical protein